MYGRCNVDIICTEKNDLKVMQERLLEMFLWYHEFCCEHKLKYYMAGGTMLGAVRHKGFTPWDDDIDVAMPRGDYERFLKYTVGKTLENIEWKVTHRRKKIFYMFTAKYMIQVHY